MRCQSLPLAFATILLALSNSLAAESITITPDKPNGVYEVGDRVHWRIEWTGESDAPSAHYKLLRGGWTEAGQGELSFSNKLATLETRLDAPGTMLVEVKWPHENPVHRALGGAVSAADQIRPAMEPPADFEAFWQSKIRELEQVPANPVLDQIEIPRTNVSYWKIRMDNIRGTHIQGQLARPAQGTKFPALLIVQWAGVYPLEPNWAVDRAAEGWLTLNIEAHDLPIDNPKEFYREQSDGPLKDYAAVGNDDRETSYFLRMFLSCYRAVEYLMHRPDWDGKTLVVMGTSQGGWQTLMTAGLHPDNITAALALVPAGCDLLGPEAGRAPGWPQWYLKTQGKDAKKVREASRYYDIDNFARRIKCPVLVGVGLIDETCPPSGVMAAFNEIATRKELVILPKSGHQDVNGSQVLYQKRCYEAWLPALRQGQPPPIARRDGDSQFEKLLAQDDAAQSDVEKWRQENLKLGDKRTKATQAELDWRINARLEPIGKAYADFLRLHPNHPGARVAYGTILAQQQDEAGAQVQWEKALELDPQNADAYHRLAGRYCDIGAAKKAFDFFTKAIELKPSEALYYHDFADALYVLRGYAATNYGLTEQQVFVRALLLYSNAVSLEPLNSNFAWDFAQTYYALKPLPYELALTAWTNALAGAQTELDREEVYLHLARVKMLAGRLAEARAQLDSVTDESAAKMKARLLAAIDERQKADPK